MKSRIFCIILLLTVSCTISTNDTNENNDVRITTFWFSAVPTITNIFEDVEEGTATYSPLPIDSPIIFLQQTQNSAGEALLIGEVMVIDNCLRVDVPESSIDYIPIWARDLSLRDENGVVEVLNEQGKVVARVGEKIYADGGGIPADSDMSWIPPLAKPLPDLCPGQYWAIGEVDPLE